MRRLQQRVRVEPIDLVRLILCSIVAVALTWGATTLPRRVQVVLVIVMTAAMVKRLRRQGAGAPEGGPPRIDGRRST
jgi:N-acyl-L-homoserine lactone synthetase